MNRFSQAPISICRDFATIEEFEKCTLGWAAWQEFAPMSKLITAFVDRLSATAARRTAKNAAATHQPIIKPTAALWRPTRTEPYRPAPDYRLRESHMS